MSHHNDDWDSEAAGEIFEWLFWWGDGTPNWFTITLALIGIGLALYHWLG